MTFVKNVAQIICFCVIYQTPVLSESIYLHYYSQAEFLSMFCLDTIGPHRSLLPTFVWRCWRIWKGCPEPT